MKARSAPWPWIAIVIALGLLSKGPYRSYVYDHGLSDFGLANVLPSFLTIILFVFLVSRWWNKPGAFAGALGACLGTEIVQVDITGRTFDPWDMVAVALGWLVAVALLRFPRTELHADDRAEQCVATDRRENAPPVER